jgi:hypothetical protein
MNLILYFCIFCIFSYLCNTFSNRFIQEICHNLWNRLYVVCLHYCILKYSFSVSTYSCVAGSGKHNSEAQAVIKYTYGFMNAVLIKYV